MLQKIERSEGHRRLQRLSEVLRVWSGPFHMKCWNTCALNVATRISEFNELGFARGGDFGLPSYQGQCGYYGAAKFFDLSFAQAFDLFNGEDRQLWRPTDAADAIDNLLDQMAPETV